MLFTLNKSSGNIFTCQNQFRCTILIVNTNKQFIVWKIHEQHMLYLSKSRHNFKIWTLWLVQFYHMVLQYTSTILIFVEDVWILSSYLNLMLLNYNKY